jgi:hypothetical protein
MSRHRAARMTLLAFALALGAVASRAPAVTFTWTGYAGSPSWQAFVAPTLITNWNLPFQVPVFPFPDPTTQLVFTSSVGSFAPVQDMANPFVLNRITFGGDSFSLGGLPIQFVNDGATPPAVFVNTDFPQVMNNNLILAGGMTIAGSLGNPGITLGGTISGTGSLTDDVPTTLSGGSIVITGGQTYSRTVTLGANTTLSSSGSIAFGDMLNGPFALTTNANATTTFAGRVGGFTPLASLSANGAGTTVITGGGVTTTGAQTYVNPVQVSGPITTFSSTGGGNITFVRSTPRPHW